MIKENTHMYFAFFKKLKFVSFIKEDIFNFIVFVFCIHLEKKYLVMNKELNMEEAIPMIRVIAKPLIGPESK